MRWAFGGLAAVLGWLGAEKLRARLRAAPYPPPGPSRPPVPLSATRAKTRAVRAERYSSKAKAEVAEANREARRREQITQPNRGDWFDLRKLNDALDREDDKGSKP
ncbi:MAG: hypothetical protein IPG45_05895 [Deltaproteobacteria bacterium]|nr:hypothetical protein [Deltaproteobacteria bacterium]